MFSYYNIIKLEINNLKKNTKHPKSPVPEIKKHFKKSNE